jgi:uncharacterized membrane protein YfcA
MPEKKISKLAVCALVSSIFFPVVGISLAYVVHKSPALYPLVGLILGIVLGLTLGITALIRMRKNPDRLGRIFAWLAIAVALAIIILIALILNYINHLVITYAFDIW